MRVRPFSRFSSRSDYFRRPREAGRRRCRRRRGPQLKSTLWPKPLPEPLDLRHDRRCGCRRPGPHLDCASDEYVRAHEIYATAKPPASECCVPAPPFSNSTKKAISSATGRSGRRLRLARFEPRHHRRLQGQRLDWRQQPRHRSKAYHDNMF